MVILFTTSDLMSNIIGPGIAEGDENCKKFMEKTMPDAFQKVSGLLFVSILIVCMFIQSKAHHS